MLQILAIARLTVLVTRRRGVVLGTVLMVCTVAAFIFAVSIGDKTLLNELQLRLQYSYALSYSLLTLMVIAAACFQVRAQIDGRQMHLLTSRPIERWRIWLGQWLGLSWIAALAAAALLLTLVASALVYARSYPAAERDAAWQALAVSRRECLPLGPSLPAQTRARLDRLIADGALTPDEIDHSVWQRNYELVRREAQRIDPHGQRTWHFDLGSGQRRGEAAELRYRLYAQDRRAKIKGVWQIAAAGKPEAYEIPFESFPFTYVTVGIPLAMIPGDGIVDITMVSQNDAEVIVQEETGLRLYYQHAGVAANLVKAGLSQCLHLAVTVAVGMLAGVAFTFSVASFLTGVLYLLSISAGMFRSVISELSYTYDPSFWERLAVVTISGGMWLVKGLQPPAVIGSVSAGISVPLDQLAIAWLPSLAIYAVGASVLGMWLLSGKELDKIPSQGL